MPTPPDWEGEAERLRAAVLDIITGKTCRHPTKFYTAVSIPGRTTLMVYCSAEKCRAYLGTVG